uniref:Uncharacterized protein n=1 Tax=Cucumis melo TaxID=3656 RepID=A0A9I9EF25_CUCME
MDRTIHPNGERDERETLEVADKFCYDKDRSSSFWQVVCGSASPHSSSHVYQSQTDTSRRRCFRGS